MGELMDTATTPVEPRLLIDVPAGFAGIPITGSGEQIADHIRRLAEQIEAPDPGQGTSNEESLGGIAHFLAQHDVRLFGRFAASDDDLAEPALANLAVAMPTLETPPGVVAAVSPNRNAIAAMLVKQYLRRHPNAEAHVVTLASGPALVAQRAGDHRISPEVAGQSHDVVIPEFKAEVQVPSPDATRLVVMVVTTTSEAGWPAVAAEAMCVANSIRFEYPDEHDSRQSPRGH
jgi:hypothetical protein